MQSACLRSFLRHGHKVVLHCYKPPIDVPDGVAVSNANQLLPEGRVVRSKINGSYSVFSDLLRLQVLNHGLGLYVDCDMYCLKPISDEDYIFGIRADDSVANAVLKVPPDCPVLAELRPLIEGKFIPPWASTLIKTKLYLRSAIGLQMPGCEALPVGWAGSKAFNWYARKHGIYHHAKPQEVFYSLPKKSAVRLFDPDLTLEELISPHAVAVHLWNDYCSRKGRSDFIPLTSPMGRIISSP
jgi:hypothetical protein